MTLSLEARSALSRLTDEAGFHKRSSSGAGIPELLKAGLIKEKLRTTGGINPRGPHARAGVLYELVKTCADD